MLRRQSDKAEYLRKIPMFEGLSKKDLNALARSAEQIDLSAGETIVAQGDNSQSAAYVLVSGTAVVRRNNRKVAELGPGDVIGELSLLIDEPRSATVVASEDGTALEIHRRHFVALVDESPAMARRIMEQLADRLNKADRKLYG